MSDEEMSKEEIKKEIAEMKEEIEILKEDLKETQDQLSKAEKKLEQCEVKFTGNTQESEVLDVTIESPEESNEHAESERPPSEDTES